MAYIPPPAAGAPRVRFLPFATARRAQATVAALRTAWQRGEFRHSPLRPRAVTPATRARSARPSPSADFTVPPRRRLDRPRLSVSMVTLYMTLSYHAAQRWSVSYNYLVRLATCESGSNPGAYNPSGASGLFQFMPSTYYGYAGRIGEGRSLWDAYANANVAAYMISVGQAYQWTCSRYI